MTTSIERDAATESQDPAAKGAHVPLITSYWLAQNGERSAWLEPVVDRAARTYHFKVSAGKPKDSAAVRAGTKVLLVGLVVGVTVAWLFAVLPELFPELAAVGLGAASVGVTDVSRPKTCATVSSEAVG